MIPNANQYPGPAWNALPYNVYSDGPGVSNTLQAGDSPNGQLNLGQNQSHSLSQLIHPEIPGFQPGGPMRPAYQPGDVRGILQAMLGLQQHKIGIPDLPPGFRQMPLHVGGGPNHGFNLGSAQPMPFQMHHDQVSAAGNLARFLAQQHTAGLRRYNGRT